MTRRRSISAKQQVPWRRVIVEGVVIVGSILLAFGLQAWWEGSQEDDRRQALLVDLRAELEFNRAELEEDRTGKRLRADHMKALLNELTPTAVGLSEDSIRALQHGVAASWLYYPATGILELLIASGDLTLLENRELRSNLMQLGSRSAAYLVNQDYLLSIETGLVYESGSLLTDMSDFLQGDDLITTAHGTALKNYVTYLTMTAQMTEDLMLPHAETMLADLDRVIQLLGPGEG